MAKKKEGRMLTEEEQRKVEAAMPLAGYNHIEACVKAGVLPRDGKYTWMNDKSYKLMIGSFAAKRLGMTAAERARSRGMVLRDVLQEQWLNYCLEGGSLGEFMDNIDVTTEKGQSLYLRAFEAFSKITFPAHIMHPEEKKDVGEEVDGATLDQLLKRREELISKSGLKAYDARTRNRDNRKLGPPIDTEAGGGPEQE